MPRPRRSGERSSETTQPLRARRAASGLRRDHGRDRRARRGAPRRVRELDEIAERQGSEVLEAWRPRRAGAVALAEGDAPGRARRHFAAPGGPGRSSTRRTRPPVRGVLVGAGLPRARRRGHGRARAGSGARRVFARWGRRPTSPARRASSASAGRGVHGLTVRELEVLRLVARREEQPRDRGRARHQRAHGRTPRAEHLRQARRLVASCGERVRVRARPDLTQSTWHERAT